MERVNTQGNMRIDKGDFDAVSRMILIDLLTSGRTLWLPPGRQAGTPATQFRILSGFTASQSTDEITVTRGTALLAIYDEGALKLGYLGAEESPDSITIDMAGKSNGDWYIYMRAVILPADQENRVIWDPATPAESVVSMNTRLTPTWEIVPVLSTGSPPGNGEYIPIHKVTMSAGSVTALADMRHMFFHGSVLDSHDHEWGDAAADRDGTNLIGDLHKFVQMVRRQLHDIITTTASNLTGPLEQPAITLEKLAPEHNATTGEHTDINADTVYAENASAVVKAVHGKVTNTAQTAWGVYGQGDATKGSIGVAGNSFGYDANQKLGLVVPLCTGQVDNGANPWELIVGGFNTYWESKGATSELQFHVLLPDGFELNYLTVWWDNNGGGAANTTVLLTQIIRTWSAGTYGMQRASAAPTYATVCNDTRSIGTGAGALYNYDASVTPTVFHHGGVINGVPVASSHLLIDVSAAAADMRLFEINLGGRYRGVDMFQQPAI